MRIYYYTSSPPCICITLYIYSARCCGKNVSLTHTRTHSLSFHISIARLGVSGCRRQAARKLSCASVEDDIARSRWTATASPHCWFRAKNFLGGLCSTRFIFLLCSVDVWRVYGKNPFNWIARTVEQIQITPGTRCWVKDKHYHVWLPIVRMLRNWWYVRWNVGGCAMWDTLNCIKPCLFSKCIHILFIIPTILWNISCRTVHDWPQIRFRRLPLHLCEISFRWGFFSEQSGEYYGFGSNYKCNSSNAI